MGEMNFSARSFVDYVITPRSSADWIDTCVYVTLSVAAEIGAGQIIIMSPRVSSSVSTMDGDV